MSHCTLDVPELTIGLDVGDKHCYFAAINAKGEFVDEGRVGTTPKALQKLFEMFTDARVVLETGTQSAWITELLEKLGHTPIVAHARKVEAIYSNSKKTDRVDAKMLARLGRVDVELLSPIRVRGRRERKALAVLRARDDLVTVRTQLVNHVRSVVKTWGSRIKDIGPRTFGNNALEQIPEDLKPALAPLVETIAAVTKKIRALDRLVEKISEEQYPETKLLRQVPGVGPITALAFVLVIGDPRRFPNARAVGSYLGVVPRLDESGNSSPELSITKQGDGFLRRLLVGSAQYILGPFASDSDLRDFGLAIAARGRKNAKRKAVVATARKLTVLLYTLWVTGDTYNPRHRSPRKNRRGVMRTSSVKTAKAG